MARYTIPFGTNISLSAATAKTVAAFSVNSTRRRRLVGFELGFDSIDAEHNAVLYEIIRTDGTTAGTATSRTPVAVDAADVAAACSGFVNYTAEPTTVTVVREGRVTPVGGGIIYPFEFLDAIVTGVANALLGLRLTAAQAQSNIRGTLTFEES
jgi:hypothetical protein